MKKVDAPVIRVEEPETPEPLHIGAVGPGDTSLVLESEIEPNKGLLTTPLCAPVVLSPALIALPPETEAPPPATEPKLSASAALPNELEEALIPSKYDCNYHKHDKPNNLPINYPFREKVWELGFMQVISLAQIVAQITRPRISNLAN